MSGRPHYTQITAYLPAGAVAYGSKRLSSPPRRVAQRPSFPLSGKTWRAWASFLLAGDHRLPEKDARHLRVCIMQRGHLTKAQMQWIFDIVARNEPAGCGTWGAPG